jgi:hypothetical protein
MVHLTTPVSCSRDLFFAITRLPVHLDLPLFPFSTRSRALNTTVALVCLKARIVSRLLDDRREQNRQEFSGKGSPALHLPRRAFICEAGEKSCKEKVRRMRRHRNGPRRQPSPSPRVKKTPSHLRVAVLSISHRQLSPFQCLAATGGHWRQGRFCLSPKDANLGMGWGMRGLRLG